MLSIVHIFSLSLTSHVKCKIHILGAIVSSSSVALAVRKARFVSRNIGLK